MERITLENFNHWWLSGSVDPELALPFKRLAYYEVEKQVDTRFILALVGLRRVGKTTTMYQLIQSLIDKKVKPQNLLFFSFDENSETLDSVMETYLEIQKKDLREERIYVFLDEVQKCKNWENSIKKYYDLYPRLKFIISGSQSLFIRRKTKESLAGRLFEFPMKTFTFIEYLQFNGVRAEQLKYESKIQPLFVRFVEKGGFPETFGLGGDKEFREYLRALVIDKIVYQDIPKSFKIENTEFLTTLVEIISANPGMYIDYQSISRQFGVDRRVVGAYLGYLKESFLISLLGNYRKGRVASLRKRKRAYPADTSMIYLHSKPDSALFGRMVETAAVNKLGAASFWKNGSEIDIIEKDVPIEIKYQERITEQDLDPIRQFMEKFGVRKGVVVTKKDGGIVESAHGTIELIPAWKWFCLADAPK